MYLKSKMYFFITNDIIIIIQMKMYFIIAKYISNKYYNITLNNLLMAIKYSSIIVHYTLYILLTLLLSPGYQKIYS